MEPSESSTARAALLGAISGASAGVLLNGALWGLLALTALVFGVGLFLCMGAANVMSVNNASTGDLIRSLPETWWHLFGDLFTYCAMLVAGTGGLVFLGCLVLGAFTGWSGSKLMGLRRD
jgi:hypothetical protein